MVLPGLDAEALAERAQSEDLIARTVEVLRRAHYAGGVVGAECPATALVSCGEL